MTDDLRAALQAQGAIFGEFHGLELPLHYGDPGREWRAAREGGAVSVSVRRFLAATGDDRVTFLHGMLSNDVKSLAVGAGVYAAFLTLQGKVVSDLRVYADAEMLLLDTVAWRIAALREALERYVIADDVEFAEAEEQPLLALEGPIAGGIAAEVLGLPALPSQPLAHVSGAVEGRPVRAIVASEFGAATGVLLCGPVECAAPLFDACREAGAVPLGTVALDALRIEAGVAWPGVDMDENTLLQETGRDAALSFTKGCYLGQEVVERVAARGHVNRHLVGLRLDGDQVPPAAAPVLVDGREVGYVTSGARAAAVGAPIALAMINRKHIESGTVVTVGADAVRATVVSLPFDAAVPA